MYDDFLSLELTDMHLDDITVSEEAKKNWKPGDSAKKVKDIYSKWKKQTEDLLTEILIAYLSLKEKNNDWKMTFSDWCKDAGLPSSTIVRKWILKYLDPEKYNAIVERERKKIEDSAINRTIEPIIDRMEMSITKETAKYIEVEISVFGKTFKKRINR